MNFRRKYRRILLAALVIDLLALTYFGRRYFETLIPEEIQVERGEEERLSKLLEHPLVRFSEIEATAREGVFRMRSYLFGVVPFREVKVTQTDRTQVFVSGSPVGIYLETKGVLVIDTGEIVCRDGSCLEPAKNIAKAGDYIVAFNEERIDNKKELIRKIEENAGEKAHLSVIRRGEEIPLEVTPVCGEDGGYKLGLWVRDNTQGIGTMTYLDTDGNYGALGHGISDIDTGELMQICRGSLYRAKILSIRRGEKGSPGELSGVIRYENSQRLGAVAKNCSNGIYGRLQDGTSEENILTPIAYKQEVMPGKAGIVCDLGGGAEVYDAEITKVELNRRDTNKSFVIRVTDERLLSKTGGIVQGMSGSPVLQNGRLAGAVTHVFVQDAASGYGIFIENMLKAQNSAEITKK